MFILQQLLLLSKDAIVYNPRKGFTVDLNKVEDAEGRYKCTARAESFVAELEFNVTSKIYIQGK